jgi:hypothetical protein
MRRREFSLTNAWFGFGAELERRESRTAKSPNPEK